MSNEEKLAQAQKSAQKWLSLIDRFEYNESWSATAPYFQNNVALEDWQRTLQGIRQPLGKMSSREVTSVQYTTSLPGSPDGKYVVIQYSASFENKKSAVETVTPMLNDDGKWKVTGYYIK